MKTSPFFLFLAFLLLPLFGWGQLPLFASDSVLELKFTADFHEIIRDRSEDPEYRPADLVTYLPDGDSLVLAIRTKTRGNFRRRKSTCQFPPLRLRMEREEVEGTIYEGQKKIKLVTHCRGRRSAFEQHIFQEYLAYRMYNLLTPQSFQVRLVHITYVNTGKRPYTEEHYGFLIEDDDDMAERNGCQKIEVDNIHPLSVDPVAANRMALFQFMIGNTDWSIPARHNLEMLMPAPGADPIPVPYDFDWSGIVHAPYAEPNPMLGIQTVQDRLFRGFCRPQETWQPVIDTFQARREEIFALYEGFPYLDEGERRQAIKYLDDFYGIMDDPRRWKYNIEDQCRTNR